MDNREQRFSANLAAAHAFYAEQGHLRPMKKDRPNGVYLYMWLKNQELRIAQGTMPSDRVAAVQDLPGWAERRRAALEDEN